MSRGWFLEVSPLPAPVTHLFSATYSGPRTPFMTGREGPFLYLGGCCNHINHFNHLKNWKKI